MTGKYDDILLLPHHRSSRRKHMSLHDRAAQFAPFAALTGFEDSISEAGRITETRKYQEEYTQAVLDYKLQYLMESEALHPKITVTYFIPDHRKAGGFHTRITGKLKRVDHYRQCLLLSDGTSLPLDSITDIFTEQIAP